MSYFSIDFTDQILQLLLIGYVLDIDPALWQRSDHFGVREQEQEYWRVRLLFSFVLGDLGLRTVFI